MYQVEIEQFYTVTSQKKVTTLNTKTMSKDREIRTERKSPRLSLQTEPRTWVWMLRDFCFYSWRLSRRPRLMGNVSRSRSRRISHVIARKVNQSWMPTWDGNVRDSQRTWRVALWNIGCADWDKWYPRLVCRGTENRATYLTSWRERLLTHRLKAHKLFKLGLRILTISVGTSLDTSISKVSEWKHE